MSTRVYLTGMSEIRAGGSYYRFRRMVKALAEQGMTVHVITTSPAWKETDYTCIKWHQICSFVPSSVRSYAYFTFFLPCCLYWVVIKQIKMIVVFGPVYAALLFPLRIFPKLRIFCMVRGMLSREMAYQKRKNIVLKSVAFLEMLGFMTSDRIVVVSMTLAETIKRWYRQKEEKFFYLPNEAPRTILRGLKRAASDPLWKNAPRGASLRIFTGGVMTRRKYFESLLYAVSKLKIPCHVCIAGKPSQKDDRDYFKFLKKVAEKSGIGSHVTWTGWLEKDRLLSVLGNSDLFVSTSHHEGMSNMLLEALSLDIPCFAKNSPESVELLKDKTLIFNSPDDLAEMISHFYQKGPFYERVKTLCREALKSWSFNWEERLIKALA